MKLDYNQQAFFELLRAGLWSDLESTDLGIQGFIEPVDWEKVYQLAAEQSVIGVVLAGIDWFKVHDSRFTIPQEVLLQWIGEVQMIEQQNLAMNEFVAQLNEKLRNNDIYALLVKGQGIAQCYERPLWRACGDVDLLLDKDNYEKAERHCDSIANSRSLETAKNKERLHQEYKIGDWTVELHGTMHANLSRQMDWVIDQVQNESFSKKQTRIWKNGDADVVLPSPDNDVIFVFTHILQHFFIEGIGLRQICDWCRLIWTYRDNIDLRLLGKRLTILGLMPKWKAFSALAVEYLGMDPQIMPFYSAEAKWKRKADNILPLILETGNFGHARNMSYKGKVGMVERLYISLKRLFS